MFEKVLVANRGEIALRIVRACRDLGVRTVAVYSDADVGAPHVRLADEAVRIGPPLARKSYLNTEAILAAAREKGVQAIHPGYGFLSENAGFARACGGAGLVFIGPSARTIAMAGDKAEARKTVAALGLPVIPGSGGVVEGPGQAARVADEVGYPVILKAAGGGGGRGLRIARTASELREAFQLAAGEACAAFSNPDLYVEKYLDRPRHIEVQILRDGEGRTVHLGERECSIQRRHQKLVEESPAPCVDDGLREQLGRTAVRIADAIGYLGAGTVEFLLDARRDFYFMEINARIQVEHPVTEMVTGVDLVEQQLRIAAGEPLALSQKDVTLRGWAVECRLNAADPAHGFQPSPGEVTALTVPGGPGVRLDTYLETGVLVPPFYDSLVGKLVVWAPHRPAALRRMARALDEFQVEGIATTAGFHRALVEEPAFTAGNFDTHFLDDFYGEHG